MGQGMTWFHWTVGYLLKQSVSGTIHLSLPFLSPHFTLTHPLSLSYHLSYAFSSSPSFCHACRVSPHSHPTSLTPGRLHSGINFLPQQPLAHAQQPTEFCVHCNLKALYYCKENYNYHSLRMIPQFSDVQFIYLIMKGKILQAAYFFIQCNNVVF